MGRHRSGDGNGLWRRLANAGFWTIMVLLCGLIAIIIGLSIGLRLF